MSNKHIKGVVVTANIIQWYDFILFAFLAPQIAVNFFPGDVSSGVFKALAVFAISYLARPLGAIILGWIADKYGIGRSMRWAMLMVAIPCGMIVVMPVTSSIGIFAPVMLLALRLVQSLGMGAEYPLSAQYAYIASENSKKTFNSGLSAISAMLGMLTASAVVALLNECLSPTQMIEWGWRTAFLISLPAIIYIYKLRVEAMPVVNTGHIEQQLGTRNTKRQLLWRILLGVIIIGLAESVFYNVSVYMPEYLVSVMHIPMSTAYGINTLSSLFLLLCIIPVCYLAQKKGAYKLLITGSLFFVFASLPLYWWVNNQQKMWVFIVSQALLVMGTVGFGVGNMPFLNMLFSEFKRSSICICLAYTGGVGLLSAPGILFTSYLIKTTNNSLIPGILICFYAFLLVILLKLSRPFLKNIYE